MIAENIREIVEDEFGVDLSFRSKKRIYICARWVYFYCCTLFGDEITQEYMSGIIGFDHATVIHGLKMIETDLEINQFEYPDKYQECRDRCRKEVIFKDDSLSNLFMTMNRINDDFEKRTKQMVDTHRKRIEHQQRRLKNILLTEKL